MRLADFYKNVVKFGRDRDPRKNKKDIRSYADTEILNGDPSVDVKKIMVGVDIEVPEILLADRIRQQEGLDLVLAHHPEGSAYAALNEVMQLQVDVLEQAGVPRKLTQQLMDERMREVQRRIMPQNHTRPVDAAKLLGLPFMCMHTPADNHVYSFVQKLMDTRKPKKVADIIDLLLGIEEYKYAAKNRICGPSVILGSPMKPAGRVLVDMTGGTEGSKDIFDKLYKAGIRTIVCMHLSEEHFKKAKDANISAVIAGHISSDNLGINLLLDRLEGAAGEIFQVVDCSGFRRVRRN